MGNSAVIRLMLSNSVLYGSARLSRSFFYVLVGWWYGISSDTDSFFLVYAVTIFLITAVSSTLGQVMVPRMRAVSLGDLLLYCSPFAAGYLLLSNVFSSSFLLLLAPYVGLSVGSALLSGHLANLGRFKTPPLVTLFSSSCAVGVAFLLRDQLGLLAIPAALSIAEAIRLVLLYSLSPVGVSLAPRSFSLIGTSLGYFGILLVLSLSQVLARVFASYLESGSVTILAYAFGAMSILLTLSTSGILVTNGHFWKDLPPQQIRREWGHTTPLLVGFSVVLVGTFATAGLLARSHFESSMPELFAILVLGLPAYVAAYNATSALIVASRMTWILSSGVLHVSSFVLLAWMLLPYGVLGIGIALVSAEVIYALTLSYGVVRLGRVAYS